MKGMISPNEEPLPVVSVLEELFSSPMEKNHFCRADHSQKVEPEGRKQQKQSKARRKNQHSSRLSRQSGRNV
jgi:hypothetical protein